MFRAAKSTTGSASEAIRLLLGICSNSYAVFVKALLASSSCLQEVGRSLLTLRASSSVTFTSIMILNRSRRLRLPSMAA